MDHSTNSDPFQEEKELQLHLDSYQVEVPDFPMQATWSDRLASFLFTPTTNPFGELVVSSQGAVLFYIAPLVFALAVTILSYALLS
jgi:hypothetical protein